MSMPMYPELHRDRTRSGDNALGMDMTPFGVLIARRVRSLGLPGECQQDEDFHIRPYLGVDFRVAGADPPEEVVQAV